MAPQTVMCNCSTCKGSPLAYNEYRHHQTEEKRREEVRQEEKRCTDQLIEEKRKEEERAIAEAKFDAMLDELTYMTLTDDGLETGNTQHNTMWGRGVDDSPLSMFSAL
ncbi:uncharacterized protein B0H18DRAFT_1130418 [Fomitopsis serialis]|uniref:uncharacterized protein n=1 Tax=Fomitopsis serialis TaxID=139415 RepID=UPI0020080DB9|nr:uncharacterized protein B0H18DRAFT_1130418 [Neoantrodia serialis]KAH9910270.1 hypothetical protein B0H18DRAFT_1130418 [Neoantrodia serialis]